MHANKPLVDGPLLIFVVFVWALAALLYFMAKPQLEEFKKAEKFADEAIAIAETNGLSAAEKKNRLQDITIARLDNAVSSTFMRDLELHAAIALGVAGLLILSVEIYTKRNLRREFGDFTRSLETRFSMTANALEAYQKQIAESVWSALSKRLIPRAISSEVERIIKTTVVMEDRLYTLTIGALQSSDLPPDTFILRRELSFTVRNVSGEEGYPYQFRSRIVNPVEDLTITQNGETLRLPCHRLLKVNDETIDLSNASGSDKRRIAYVIVLPKDGTARICTVHEEPCRFTDTQVFATSVPVNRLTLRIINNYPNIEVVNVTLYHPTASFENRQQGLWIYNGGLLPGQGFAVSWRQQTSQPSMPPSTV